ncbi:hypothetical protein D9M70_605880 [compost metagenome]
MASEIAFDDVGIGPVLGLRRDGVRTRPNERQFAFQHVENLRQFIDRRLADEAADRRDARVALGHGVACRRVAHMRIHRAELVDLDRLVVEAVPLLLEDDRAGRGGFDRDGGAQHDRP